MKKKIFSCLASCLLAAGMMAQNNNADNKKWILYAGPQANIAAADLAKMHTWGIGAHIHAIRPLNNRLSLTGKVSYDYLFGKKTEGYTYTPPTEPGGEPMYSEGESRYDGMNDVNVTAGVRYNFTDRVYGDADAGFCASLGRETSFAGMFLIALGYDLNSASPLEQMLALFMGVCGDPKVKIGVRYSIRLSKK